MTIPPAIRFSARFYLLAACIAGAFAFGATCGRRTAPTPPSRVGEAVTVQTIVRTQVDTVRQTVRQLVERHRVDTLWRSDTVTVNDTVRVLVPQPVLFRMDSTIRACAKLDTLIGQERTACDRVQRALRDSLAKVKDHKWGCTVGPTGAVDRELRGALGVGITCGRRVLP